MRELLERLIALREYRIAALKALGLPPPNPNVDQMLQITNDAERLLKMLDIETKEEEKSR
jgi:hypothetical protein